MRLFLLFMSLYPLDLQPHLPLCLQIWVSFTVRRQMAQLLTRIALQLWLDLFLFLLLVIRVHQFLYVTNLVLAEPTPLRLLFRFAATPPHLPSIGALMIAATPIEVVFLIIFFLTLHADLFRFTEF